MAQSPEELQKIVQDYDTKQNIPFTIVDPGTAGNTIDVNTLSEGAVDQLIARYGGQPQLIGRKNFLQSQRMQQEATNPPVDPLQARADQYRVQNEGLWNRYTDQATNKFNEEMGRKRGKLLSDEIAAGRGGSPVSNYTTGEFDRNAGMSLSSMLGDISKQQAMGQVDLSKTIENIRNGQDQFNKTYDLEKNQFQAKINEGQADRLLSQDLARAKMQHDTDMNTPDDFQKWNGRVNASLDTANKAFDLGSNIYTLGKKPKPVA